MKNFKITYALWFAISLAMSSCSCCSVDAPPLTAYDNNFFSKYKTGDTIKLKSDSLNLDIVFSGTKSDVVKGKGGIQARFGGDTKPTGCFAYTDKSYMFKLANYDNKKYKQYCSYSLVYRSGKLPEQMTPPTTYNTFLHTIETGGMSFYKTYFIGSKSYTNVVALNMKDKFKDNLVYSVLIDSTGILGAVNYYKSIVYK